MSHVKLAIRVRPFTEKELKLEKIDAPVISVVDANTVTITNIKVSPSGAGDSRERVRVYNADYTFDSSCPTTSPNYASQEKIFNTIGSQVFASISRGTSACVLAYGQSATGKTFTMMGTDSQQGLIPRLCLAFAESPAMEISVSYLEIYNERVQDLLAFEVLPCNSLPRRKGNSRKNLRVREHPNRGPYVQNLRRVLIRDVESLLNIVREGTNRRRTAATRRNSASSRSHALLELVTPLATLQLVDLAGSEKAAEESYRGSRQTEGANINKSLVALSNVISALVRGGGPGRFVPYRDSALTWLLKDCFTGGANTFIIATLSPSAGCYGESASTLRWAARTRQLLPKRLSTITNVITKAALQAQYNTLIRELTKNFIRYVPETRTLSFDETHWKLSADKSIGNIGNIMNISPAITKDQNIHVASNEFSNIENHEDIAKEINNEIDKMFEPALERTRSSSEFEIVPPIRNKRRQYRSQEVLSANKTQQQLSQKQNSSAASQSLSEERLDEIKNNKMNISTSILYDSSQRSEIVESVTERLYSRLKKNEETAGKLDAIDKKVVQPLNELKICTNARQRLMEISQKALRNKRKIGIPAYTQTKKLIVRVKDQEIDIQNELFPYEVNKNQSYKLHRDVGTETTSITARYKEIGTGSVYGTLSLCDSSTMTNNVKKHNSTSTMTLVSSQTEQSTQTMLLPLPRKKRHSKLFYRYMKILQSTKPNSTSTQPIININIASTYNEETDSNSSTISSQENFDQNPQDKILPPDLLTDHSGFSDKQTFDQTKKDTIKIQSDDDTYTDNILLKRVILNRVNLNEVENINEDFPDSDDHVLPRVLIDNVKTVKPSEMKDMILGRDPNMYPYNIPVSPLRQGRERRRTISFEDNFMDSEGDNFDFENSSSDLEHTPFKCFEDFNTLDTNTSDSTMHDKTYNDLLFLKKRHLPRKNEKHLENAHVLENHLKTVDKTKNGIYKDLLGLKKDDKEQSCSSSSADIITKSRNLNFVYYQNKKYKSEKHNTYENDSYSINSEIRNSCKKLEFAINKYENYLNNYKIKGQSTQRYNKSPAKYLQHLIEIRKNIVKGDQMLSSNTDEPSYCKKM